MDSILETIKKLLGPDQEYTPFDTDIMVHINTTCMTLSQLGIGPKTGFFISGKEETWQQFFEDGPILHAVKTYIYLKVKLLFDPPTSSFVLDAYVKQANELEWRLAQQAEGGVLNGPPIQSPQ